MYGEMNERSVEQIRETGAQGDLRMAESAELHEMEAALEGAACAQESAEQQEMDDALRSEEAAETAQEQREMEEGMKLGYSSEYYEHRIASAIKNGNAVALHNAEKNYAKAKAREITRG